MNPITNVAMSDYGSPTPDMGNSGGMTNSPLAMMGTMQPSAMQNFMGDPSGNMGMNRLSMPWQEVLNQRPPASTYRTGGLVRMAMGGNPMEAMAQQGAMPPGQGQEEAVDPQLAEQAQMAVQFIQQFVQEQGMDLQLAHVNPEEYQALTQTFGEPEMVTSTLAKFAEGGMADLEEASEAVAGASEEDPHLVLLDPEQLQWMVENFGEPSTNEITQLPQFGFFKSVAKAVKSVVKNPIVQAIAPMALNAFAPGLGSAIGAATGLGSLGTSALMGGGLGLLGGGGLKGALTGAAMGGLGQAGADWLGSGNNPFSGIMGGGTTTPSSSGFGLNTSASSTPGISPTAGGSLEGVKMPTSSPSISGGQSGLGGLVSKLMPESTSGKVMLGLGALNALNSGKKPTAENPPPPMPFAQTNQPGRPMPKWGWTQGPNGQWTMGAQENNPGTTGALYAATGGYLGGGMVGDGVSDDIPAMIGNQQPAKLSGGEFVVPARVVAELGNGSSEAGAQRLYGMMERVNQKRMSTKDVGKNSRAYEALPV